MTPGRSGAAAGLAPRLHVYGGVGPTARGTSRTTELDRLIRAETDAAIVCSAAARMAGIADIASELAGFGDTHRRHIGELTVAVRRLGEIPAPPRRDLRGVLLQAFSRLRGVSGSPGALRGVELAEHHLQARLGAALTAPLPGDVLEVLERHQGDVRGHLVYVHRALTNRAWRTRGGHEPRPRG